MQRSSNPRSQHSEDEDATPLPLAYGTAVAPTKDASNKTPAPLLTRPDNDKKAPLLPPTNDTAAPTAKDVIDKTPAGLLARLDDLRPPAACGESAGSR